MLRILRIHKSYRKGIEKKRQKIIVASVQQMGVSCRTHSMPSMGRTGTQEHTAQQHCALPALHRSSSCPQPQPRCSAGSPAPLQVCCSPGMPPPPLLLLFARSPHHPSAHSRITLNLPPSPVLPQPQEHRSPQTLQRGSQQLQGFAELSVSRDVGRLLFPLLSPCAGSGHPSAASFPFANQ